MASESKEIPVQIVYVLILGFFFALIGGLFSVWGSVIGALIIAAGGFMAYTSQGSGMGATGLPALHRELAKTHCGTCGASMRSNMMFCPSCGARQTAT